MRGLQPKVLQIELQISPILKISITSKPALRPGLQENCFDLGLIYGLAVGG